MRTIGVVFQHVLEHHHPLCYPFWHRWIVHPGRLMMPRGGSLPIPREEEEEPFLLSEERPFWIYYAIILLVKRATDLFLIKKNETRILVLIYFGDTTVHSRRDQWSSGHNLLHRWGGTGSPEASAAAVSP